MAREPAMCELCETVRWIPKPLAFRPGQKGPSDCNLGHIFFSRSAKVRLEDRDCAPNEIEKANSVFAAYNFHAAAKGDLLDYPDPSEIGTSEDRDNCGVLPDLQAKSEAQSLEDTFNMSWGGLGCLGCVVEHGCVMAMLDLQSHSLSKNPARSDPLSREERGLPEPDNSVFRPTIYLPHALKLGVFLSVVFLVDADGIDPQG